ncbi:hypothetical protein SDC9_136975 [bioreactor metagenome]|uniref:Uncharacterized protein n=1 Tax=bioreactor metagenome TaxID=1076179 RepID=A0A645DK98_9ZZZZ
MREIMIGEAAPNYAWELEYYLYTYPNPDKPYPHRFPDEAFAKILAAKDTYYHYFAKTKALAAEAISFFKGEKKQCKSPEAINNVWLTTALHYYTLCDEFESLVSDVEAFNIGKLSARGLIFELDRLITAREALMKQAEKTRIKANGYVLLRNMSVYLRSLLDMRAYIANRINSELKFKLDLTDLSEIRSEGFAFLQ